MPEINAISTGGTTYDIVDKTALHDGSNYKPVQTAKTDPSASGTATSFITTISQNANGVISPAKANLASYKPTQTAVSDPSSSGTSASFIKSISQATTGVITATKASVPPYVTATGSTNSWAYRKWSDGTYECWRSYGVTLSSWTPWGNLYVSSTKFGALTFPTTFASTPYVQVSPVPNNDLYAFWVMNSAQTNTHATTTKTGQYQAFRGTAGGTTSLYTLNYYVKGKV